MATKDDEIKTKAKLLEEIEELRRQLAGRDETADAADAASSQPAFTRPITRRAAIGTWVAPVILSIPLTTVIRTRTADAGTTFFPTLPAPTPAPAPTVASTMAPTSFPTLATAEAPALGAGALAAAAAALAAAGAAKIRRGAQGGATADSEQPDRSADDSQDNDDGTK